MVTVSQIRDELIDFLAATDKEGTLVSFEDWIAKASWNMHLDSDIRAQQFVGEIQLSLAEMDAENLDLGWLLKKFRDSLSAFPIATPENQTITISTSSSTDFKRQEWAFSPVGSPRVEAFGL